MATQEFGVLTADHAIGSTVNQVMFLKSVTRSELARRIGTSQPTISMKLRGQIRWSLEDVLLVAQALDVDARDLMPTPDSNGGWIPAAYVPGHTNSPALTGTGHVSPH